jgi:hypothetical protein
VNDNSGIVWTSLFAERESQLRMMSLLILEPCVPYFCFGGRGKDRGGREASEGEQ